MIPKSFVVSRLSSLVMVFPLFFLFILWTIKKVVFLIQGLETPSSEDVVLYLMQSPLLLVLIYACLLIQAFCFLISWGQARSMLFVWRLRLSDLLQMLGSFLGLIFLLYWFGFPLLSTNFLPLDARALFLIHMLGLMATSAYLVFSFWRFGIRFGVLQGPRSRRGMAWFCALLFILFASVHGYDLLSHELQLGFGMGRKSLFQN